MVGILLFAGVESIRNMCSEIFLCFVGIMMASNSENQLSDYSYIKSQNFEKNTSYVQSNQFCILRTVFDIRRFQNVPFVRNRNSKFENLGKINFSKK